MQFNDTHEHIDKWLERFIDEIKKKTKDLKPDEVKQLNAIGLFTIEKYNPGGGN